MQSAGLSFPSLQLARQYPWTLYILFFPPFKKLSHAGILCLEILENRVSSGMRDALRFIYGLHASVMGKGSFITL